MRLSTWIRNAGTKKSPRLTYAPGHPAYQDLMKQALSLHATGDQSLLHLDMSGQRWLSEINSSLPFSRKIFISVGSEVEKAYHFLRHTWSPVRFPSDQLVIFAAEEDERSVEIAKSRLCYVDASTQTEPETARIVSLLLGKPPEALTEYFVNKAGTDPLSVTQTLKTLAYFPSVSRKAVDFAAYHRAPESFDTALYGRDFGACWSILGTLTHGEKIATVERTYSRFQTLRYVKREQPELNYRKDAVSGTPFVLLQEAYTYVPHYTDTHLAAAETALVEAYRWIPKYPDRALTALLALWPK